MTEILREMKTYRVYKVCPECGSYVSWRGGRSMLSSPPQYKNECENENCNYSFKSTKHYPYKTYKEAEQ